MAVRQGGAPTGAAADLVGFGVAAVDDVFVTDVYPALNTKRPLLEFFRVGGGQTATAFVAAARLGCRCRYGGRLGDNDQSEFVRGVFRREGIEFTEGKASPRAAPTYAVIVVERMSGERSILWTSEKVEPPALDDEDRETIRRAKCLLVDQSIAEVQAIAAGIAREKGIPVVGDFERMGAGGETLLRLTDHLIVPVALACGYTGAGTPEEAVRRLAGRDGRCLACVTDGEKGAWYATGERPDEVRHHPAFAMPKVVDTNGCGDIFHGAYAASLVKGLSPEECIRRASAAAALKTLKVGGQTGAPTSKELESFLARLA